MSVRFTPETLAAMATQRRDLAAVLSDLRSLDGLDAADGEMALTCIEISLTLIGQLMDALVEATKVAA